MDAARRALEEGGLAAAARLRFWEGLDLPGRAEGPVLLEVARNLLPAGSPGRAARILRDLCEEEDGNAEAHFLLARALRALGNRRMARLHAGRAAELEPENRAYRELRSELREEGR